MNTQNLIALIKKVAELRNDLKDTNERALSLKESAERILQKTPEYKRVQIITEKVSMIFTALGLAEAELRSATLAIYNETGEKKPIDKVEVKIFKWLEYDSAKVLKWCRVFAPSLMVVNKKSFEKTAVEIGAPVKVKEEAKCTIASDLSSYLKKE